MSTFVLVIHYGVSILLIGTILLQAGKGAGIGAAFGGSSQTVFGGRGPATFLNKITAGLAIIFLVTSFTLSHFARTDTSESVVDGLLTEPAIPVEEGAPATDATEMAPATPAAESPDTKK